MFLLLLLTLLLGWGTLEGRPLMSTDPALPRVYREHLWLADVNFQLGQMDRMLVHPMQYMCSGWMVDEGRPPGSCISGERKLMIRGITGITGGDQYSLIFKDVPASWIRENFRHGLLAGAWISRPEGILLPAAVMIMSPQRTIVCVDTINIIGPVSSDWERVEEACRLLTRHAEVHLVFNRLQSVDDLCSVNTRIPLRSFRPNPYGIGYDELQ